MQFFDYFWSIFFGRPKHFRPVTHVLYQPFWTTFVERRFDIRRIFLDFRVTDFFFRIS